MIEIVENAEKWDDIVRSSHGHPLQLFSWGDLKAAHGPWKATRVVVKNSSEILGGAQILTRSLPKPLTTMLYIPRGPFFAKNNGENDEIVLREITSFAKHMGAIELKIEPDIHADDARDFRTALTAAGFRQSRTRVLLPHTIQLDLTRSEDDLRAAMSKKTRQYIRKSAKDGVTIREATHADVEQILKIYKETARRDNFPLHSDGYYSDLAEFGKSANEMFVAENNGNIIAFLWNYATPENCFELYGGVNEEGQSLRANFPLKWTAISYAKTHGTRIYDLNGLLNDGVSNFKRGWGEECELVGAWDFPLSPMYAIYENLLPAAKKVMRKLRRQ